MRNYDEIVKDVIEHCNEEMRWATAIIDDMNLPENLQDYREEDISVLSAVFNVCSDVLGIIFYEKNH